MKKIVLDFKQFQTMYDSVKNAVATDDSRPVLKNIEMQITAQKITATALDGYVLAQTVIEYSEQDTESFSIIIPIFTLPTQMKPVNVVIEFVDNIAIFLFDTGYGEIVYKFKQFGDEFINHKNVIKTHILQDKNDWICFDAVKLKNALNCFKGRHNVCMLHYDSKNKCSAFYIDSNNPEENYGCKFMKMILPIKRFE